MKTELALLDRYLGYPDASPQSARELDMIVAMFKGEIGERKCLFVPSHLERYYEWDEVVSDAVFKAYPNASGEIREAGTCLAAGLHTASVFHAMRAVEIGLRSVVGPFNVQLKGNKPLEIAEWRDILDGLSVAARDVENRPNADPNKDSDSLFLSEASAQFRFFKNGWRIRVAHARATYNEPQAKEAVDHVRSFFETLATRLTE